MGRDTRTLCYPFMMVSHLDGTNGNGLVEHHTAGILYTRVTATAADLICTGKDTHSRRKCRRRRLRARPTAVYDLCVAGMLHPSRKPESDKHG